jgi:hypothetical protein
MADVLLDGAPREGRRAGRIESRSGLPRNGILN